MKNLILYFSLFTLFACQSKEHNTTNLEIESINKSFFLELGGVEQYIEIIGTSTENPILLFVHGGPAWPQTPQIRYFNSELAEAYTLVIWEQRGAGKNFEKNPNPGGLSLDQIVKDGNQLAEWLVKEYAQEKIYLAGYSWGSLVGVEMASQHPEFYKAYFGISQFINKQEGMEISRKWVKEKAQEAKDEAALQKIDSLEDVSNYKDEHTRFFNQYLLVNQYGGAVHQDKTLAEVEKAETIYEDYQNYDWYAVWNASSSVLQKDLYVADVRDIKELKVPVVLFQGRFDWNVPSVLAESWLDDLKAPQKEIIWFENSGHGPLEEEPKEFNQAMIQILKELN